MANRKEADEMSKVAEANHYIDLIREHTDEVLLFNSMGKDSLVLLDLLYPKFKRVVCVFMYFVKGLDHIERYVNWCRAKYPKIEIIQVPHWNLTYILRSGTYCVANPNIKLLKLRDMVEAMQIHTGVYYTFLGMKKADSLNRRLMLKGYEGRGYENEGLVYPLADWTQKDILAYMRQKKLPQPVRYSHNASGGVGFNAKCFLWMREHAPQDLQRVLKAFPMSERILYEYDNKKERDERTQ